MVWGLRLGFGIWGFRVQGSCEVQRGLGEGSCSGQDFLHEPCKQCYQSKGCILEDLGFGDPF